MKNHFKEIFFTIMTILIVNVLGNYYFFRLDLTADKRYTLSETTLNILKNVKEPLYFEVYLDGEIPAEFRKLQSETNQMIEELKAYNSNIIVQYIDPLEDKDPEMKKIKGLFKKGLTPVNVSVKIKGKQTQTMVFPWAIASYRGKSVNVPLLKNLMGASTEQKVIGSVQHLEYSFADALQKITTPKQKKIAIIKGNGEMADAFLSKFLLQIRDNYHLAPFTLDAVDSLPNLSLSALKKFDLAIIVKPTIAFSDKEKQVLDQFVVSGGKTLWLIDQVKIEMDSLKNQNGRSIALPNDLNLNDLFFKYGFRISPDLIKDEQGTPIKLVTGAAGSNTQFQEFNWKFAPYILSQSKHPISNNLGGIKLDFANPIDTLKNKIKKTILLQSSKNSKKVGTPTQIDLNMVADEANPNDYQAGGNMAVSVLLEGQFHSVYENRVLPFSDTNFKNFDKKSSMIVVADGDIIKNQLDKDGIPVELGYDQKTGVMFDNKDFLINATNYLLDDTGLMSVRNKQIELPLLDQERMYECKTEIQFLTIILPIMITALMCFGFYYFRKRKYTKHF